MKMIKNILKTQRGAIDPLVAAVLIILGLGVVALYIKFPHLFSSILSS